MNDQNHPDPHAADPRDGLEQKLIELIYDLLPEKEAAQLNDRISSDPDVARAYAAMRLRIDVLAKAARLEQAPVSLQPPAPTAALPETTGDRAAKATPAKPANALRRGTNWFVGLAASALVLTVGYFYLRPDSPINPVAVRSAQQQIADQQVRLEVRGPGRLHADVTNYFTVATRSGEGQPVSAPVEYLVYSPAEELLAEGGAKTDERGEFKFELPPSVGLQRNSRLDVHAAGGQEDHHLVSLNLDVDETSFVTHLSFDKPLYRPGETVYFRSLTLSRFGLKPDREMPLHFEILDPAGSTVPESALDGATHLGVGNGRFDIPPQLAGGTYALVVQSLDDSFPEAKREFAVRQYRTPRLKKELELTRDSYAPGDQVVADFSATRAEGGPAAGAQLKIIATVDGQPVTIEQPSPKAASDGTYRVEFALPEEIEKGAGTLAVVVDDGGTRETIAETIPINLGKVDVHFYPEGGDLVAGLENRVYFHAVDPLGEPVHAKGRLVDKQDNEITEFETVKEGRGTIRFRPQARVAYHLEIDSPPGVTNQPELPRTTAGRWLVMDTGKGVFEPDEAISLNVYGNGRGADLIATAVCRGAQVGRANFPISVGVGSDADRKSRGQLTLPIAPEAAGVVRVTIYDNSGLAPEPIAERLVYRKPARQLNVELADGGEPTAFSPGDSVKLTLQVSDETGDPVAAALGVAVVDDALLNLADDKSPQMTTHFLLTTEIEKPENLEDANFFLSDDADSAEALDLLLGTQGWRRFAEKSLTELTQLAAAGTTASEQIDAAFDEIEERREALAQLVALEGLQRPPAIKDNGDQVEKSYSAALADFTQRRAANINQFGWGALMAGTVLLVALSLLGAFRLAGDARVWVPAVAIAGVCCLVGITWMGAEPTADGQIAFRTWSAFSPGERMVAQATGDEDAEAGKESTRADRSSASMTKALGIIFEEDEEATPERLRLWEDVGAVDDDYDATKNAGPALAFGLDPRGLPGAHLGLPVDGRIHLGGIALGEGKADWGGHWRGEGLPAGKLADHIQMFDVDGERFAGRGFDVALFPYLANRAKAGQLEGDIRQLALLGQQGRRWAREGVGGGMGGGGGGGFGLGTGWYYQDASKYAAYQTMLEQFRLPVRVYAHQHRTVQPGVRSDFAETVYWHPLLIADDDGLATIEFELSDSVTTFRVQADAHGGDRIGSGGGEVVSRIPFSLEPKLPLEVNAGDRIDLPVAVNNDTDESMPVELTLETGELLRLAGEATRQLSLPAAERRREFFSLDVVGQKGEAMIEVRGAAGNLTDAVRKPIRVVPPGFPVSDSYAGRLTEDQTLVIPMPEDWVNGSLEVKVEAFPSSLADLQKGLDSILREPHGCFEQTSTSNYPNVLALLYMQENDVADPAFTRRAKELLKKGYGKLVSFECSKKGYEWFGGDPGHEALTAYGLLEFRDMSAVWDVDPEMVDRTAKWLLDRRDGEGGFQRNAKSLDSFGSAPQEITNAYIVWALTEAEQTGIEKEVEHVISRAKESDDPYLIALAAAAAMKTERKADGAELLDRLAQYQKEDGHLEATDGTITRSGGLSMQMETTALAAMAWLKEPRMRENADKAIDWIGNHRQGSGGFGSTQATILALKALIEHAKASKATVSSGALYVKRGDDELGRTEFVAGETKTVVVQGLEAQIQPGENELTIGLTGDNEMPYVVDVSYRTHKPASDENCPLRLKTSLTDDKVAAGATVGLSVELSNVSGKGQPMTVAVVGLPAGLEARVEKLDELKEAGRYDYYEINARELIFYWRSLSPEAKDAERIEFDLDLVAEIPGRYTAPASRAYLYYTPEQKQWIDPLKIEISMD